MAEIEPWDEEKRAAWAEWVASRPPNVRAVAERLFPNRLYRLKTTGQRVFPLQFDEHADGSVSVRVAVSAKFNFVIHERRVFGIDPNDLEECELPDPAEPSGALLSPQEVEQNIDGLRKLIGIERKAGA